MEGWEGSRREVERGGVKRGKVLSFFLQAKNNPAALDIALSMNSASLAKIVNAKAGGGN